MLINLSIYSRSRIEKIKCLSLMGTVGPVAAVLVVVVARLVITPNLRVLFRSSNPNNHRCRHQ